MTNHDLSPAERLFAQHLAGASMGFWALQWRALEAADEHHLHLLNNAFPDAVATLLRYRTDPNLRARIAHYLKDRDANG